MLKFVCEVREIISKFSRNFRPLVQNLIFSQIHNRLDAKWKHFVFNRIKIKRKFRENEKCSRKWGQNFHQKYIEIRERKFSAIFFQRKFWWKPQQTYSPLLPPSYHLFWLLTSGNLGRMQVVVSLICFQRRVVFTLFYKMFFLPTET